MSDLYGKSMGVLAPKILNYVDDLSDAQTMVDALEIEVNEKNTEIENLEDRVSRKKYKIQSKNNLIEELKDEIREKNDELEVKDREISELRDEIKQILTHMNKTKEKRLFELTALVLKTVEEMNDTIYELKGEKSILKTDLRNIMNEEDKYK
jgi:chromosome segregation ATPase